MISFLWCKLWFINTYLEHCSVELFQLICHMWIENEKYGLVQKSSLSLNLMSNIEHLRLVSGFSVIHMNIYTHTLYVDIYVDISFVYVNHNFSISW